MVLAAPPLADAAYAKALALLDRIPLIDGHNDLPYVVRLDRSAKGDLGVYDLGKVHPETDTDIPRMQAGKLAGQFFAAYVPPNHPKPAGFALAQIALMRQIWERHADVFRPGSRLTMSKPPRKKAASPCS
jgi:membrane dipeptidase